MMRTSLILALLLVFAVSASGVTLEAYKAKIESAWVAAYEAETEMDRGRLAPSGVDEFAARVRRDFALSEPVDWPGGTIETANDWLLEQAEVLEKEADSGKRLKIVIEIREYLGAIAYKLQELQSAGTSDRTKDEDKQKLAEILRREEFQKPAQKEESTIQRWLREFLYWLASLFPKPQPSAGSFAGMELLALVLQVLLFAGLLALLVFLVYKIALRIFPGMKRAKSAKKKPRVILGEHIGDDESAGSLFGEAERLARDGDLRGAIRKGYIALLCELSDRKIIGLARHKTNRDYLRDVRPRIELHPRMKAATDTFERNWYGSERSDEQAWTRFRDEYNDAIRSV